MAALDPLQFPCPACGEPITIPLSATPGDREGDTVTVGLSADPGPALEHVDRHLADPNWLVPSLYENGEE